MPDPAPSRRPLFLLGFFTLYLEPVLIRYLAGNIRNLPGATLGGLVGCTSIWLGCRAPAWIAAAACTAVFLLPRGGASKA